MEGKQLRIVYMGTPEFAVTPLKTLIENGYNVVGVVTMPDKAAGRGLKVQQSAVKTYALEASLPVLQPEKLKDPEFIEAFRTLDADLGIVIAFRMLPEVIWAMPRLGTFNLHASLLPQYRGAAPINWSIINGDTKTGVTTFMLNHEIDKGDMLGQRVVKITPEDNAGTLHDKLMYAGCELVTETVEKIASGNIEPISQVDTAEYLRPAPKIFKETSLINWNAKGEDIHNLVRGLSPYPAAWSQMTKACENSGSIQVKIFETSVETIHHSTPVGTIISDNKTFIKVACADGYIYILELQIAGKKRMEAAELLRGFQNIVQYRFTSPRKE